MNKTAIIYSSRYGATQRYAEALARLAEADLFAAHAVAPARLAAYHTLVFGGGVYVGRIDGVKLLAKHAAAWPDQRLALFTVGLAEPAAPETAAARRQAIEQQLPAQICRRLACFHLRGALDYSRLGPLHRMMMRMMAGMLQKKPPAARSDSDQGILDAIAHAVDFYDETSLAPLLAFCRGE